MTSLLLMGAHLFLATGACDSAEQRAFDFWLGQWDVYAKDKLIAHSTISLAAKGCAIHEQYQTLDGFAGESLNGYDAKRGVWHQTWIDQTGEVLLLEGEFDNAQMQLRGSGRRPEAKSAPGQAPIYVVYQQHITWRVQPDGSVRQVWQADAGDDEWQTLFDGVYRKRGDASTPPTSE